MRLIILATLCFAALALGRTIHSDEEQGWFVPQLNDSFVWMSKQEYELSTRTAAPRASATVKFYLYTKSSPSSPREVPINDVSALSAGHFNKAHPTRFIIHGWGNDYKSEVNTEVRGALLATGDYNVFCVDWSGEAAKNYVTARNSVSEVGSSVASFVDFLNEKAGMSFNDVNVIGHSLGAQVAGYTGKLVKRGRIHTIVGLDPAMPLFSYSDCATRLCSTDANFVESIQTNGGLKGFLQPIGKAAFYPNGGQRQPGCGTDATGVCAHARSVIYYAEAIRKNDFPTMKCSTYEKAVDKECGSTYSSVRMGAPSNYGISGYYYVPVRSTSPYGMGS